MSEIIGIAKVNVKGEITKDKEYKVYFERFDTETKADEILIICDMGFEKWYKSELFMDKIKEVTND